MIDDQGLANELGFGMSIEYIDNQDLNRAWSSLSRTGQVNVGDSLRYSCAGQLFTERVHVISNPGTDEERVFFGRSGELSFGTRQAIYGSRNHKVAK